LAQVGGCIGGGGARRREYEEEGEEGRWDGLARHICRLKYGHRGHLSPSPQTLSGPPRYP